MSRKAFGGAMVLALGISGAVAAQSTSQGTAQQPATPAQQQMAAHTVKVEGCLVREEAVQGREPNVAERAGVMEDYILTGVKFLEGAPQAHGAAGTSGATGTSGAATGEAAGTSGKADAKKTKLEIRGIDDERLQQFVGQRVEIEGKIDPQDFAEGAREQASPAGEKTGDLPELEGTVIRKASSNEPCPPAGK